AVGVRTCVEWVCVLWALRPSISGVSRPSWPDKKFFESLPKSVHTSTFAFGAVFAPGVPNQLTGDLIMKKPVLLMASSVSDSANAFGFGIPSTGSRGGDAAVSLGKKGVNKGLEASINDKLAKKNCAFVDSKTKTDTTCNLDAIIKDLQGWRTGLESTIANNV